MPVLEDRMQENRDAVNKFIAAAERVPAPHWTRERAPGKWSPAQIAEHIAISYELSLLAMRGTFPGTAAPRFLRPLIRTFFLKPVLKRGGFPRPAKAPANFQPAPSPAAAEVILPRIRAASAALEREIAREAAAGRDSMDHPFFGSVSLADYLQLQAIHTAHHLGQLPA